MGLVLVSLILVTTVVDLLFGNDDAQLADTSIRKCLPAEHWRAREDDSCSFATSGAGGTQSPAVAVTIEPDHPTSLRSRERRTSGTGEHPRRRPWQTADGAAQDLVPAELVAGITLAELCSYSDSASSVRCRSVSPDRFFSEFGDESKADGRDGFAIAGHVLAADGKGLGGVNVVAWNLRSHDRVPGDSHDSIRFWTVTDEHGAYRFDGVPDGEYEIRSTAVEAYGSARIQVRAGVEYADLVVVNQIETVARGQVRSNDGVPLEGVTVLPVLAGQPSVITDGDGRFRLPLRLKPMADSLTLRFQRPGFREHSARIDIGRNGVGNDVAVQVSMKPVESWAAISGEVRSESGGPLAGRTVVVRALESRHAFRASTDYAGRFEFSALAVPDDYYLTVYGGTEHKDFSRQVIFSFDSDPMEIALEPYEFGSLTGTLVNAAGVPIPDFELVLRHVASKKPNVTVRTDRNGNFEIAEAPAGDLVIASQSTPSILIQGLTLDVGEHLDIPLVLDWGEHQIRGVVLDAENNPVPASRVVLHWAHEDSGIRARATRRTAADTQGLFAFSNLGPGPHSLNIEAPGYEGVSVKHDLSREGYDLTVKLN